jgi:L-fuculose-phosphate aldolase
MMLEKERNLIVEYGKKLITQGLTKGTGGNISIFDREQQLMAISPSGMDYFKTTPEDVVVMNLKGEIVEGYRKPSVEHDLHSIFYEKRKDINAVVHTHSVFSVVLASLGWNIPAAFYLEALSGGPEVRCAKYATFGTRELAENTFEAMQDRYAALMANHGLIAGGKNIASAFTVAEEIEFCAEVFYRAKCVGEPVIVPDEEIYAMLKPFRAYGQ